MVFTGASGKPGGINLGLLSACIRLVYTLLPTGQAGQSSVASATPNVPATVIIQHDARDVDRLPAFPAGAKLQLSWYFICLLEGRLSIVVREIREFQSSRRCARTGRFQAVVRA